MPAEIAFIRHPSFKGCLLRLTIFSTKIDTISEQLRRELPGLRGFSAQSIRNMRQFAEFWQPYLICSPTASKLEIENLHREIEYDRFALSKWSPIE